MSANTIWIATAAVHRLPIHLHGLQLPLDFFVDFLQFFLGEFLHGPSDDQTTLVGFLRFRDDVEVDVRNDLGDRLVSRGLQISEVLRLSPGEQSFRCSDRSRYVSSGK
jgi:hypothetical protein